MSEQAFLSGAPVKERTGNQLEIFELRAEGDVLYCRASNMKMAADIFWRFVGVNLSNVGLPYTLSILNELPYGHPLINES